MKKKVNLFFQKHLDLERAYEILLKLLNEILNY